MKFERATIYKRYHANTSVSYMLVLNTHRMGMSFAYLTESCNNKFYSNINDLYIGDIGSYVSIDRILYLDWSKIISKHYEKYRELSGREMRKITMAIKDLYDGIISYDNHGILIYTDMEAETTNVCSNEKISKIPIAKDETATKTAIIETTNTIPKSTVEELLLDNGINIEHGTEKDEKYIDLLVNPTRAKSRKSRPYTRSNNVQVQRSENGLNRRMFSESEALAITTMSSSEVIQKYNVSISIADQMKRNANEYFGFSNKDKCNSETLNITRFFRQGLTVDQVMSAHPELDIKSVRASYQGYCISKIDKTASVIDLQKEILEGGSINDFIEVDGMTYTQFCTKYKCSLNTAKVIKVAVRCILSKNIYFAVFGAEAYRGLNTRIKNASQNSVRNRIDIANFNTCMRLKNVYEATYDDHFDIITGSKPIPEDLKGKDRERFINIIKQRCNERVYDRTYTIDQLHMIDNQDVDGLASILVINYNKAKNIIYRKNPSDSNVVGG